MDRMKTNIKLFYAISLLQGMVFYGPVATLYRQAQGLTVFDITLIESISLIVMIALELPWGYISDKIGYKNTILICNVLFFVSKIVFWKADSFALFLLERLMLSVILSGLSGCDSAFLYVSAGEKESHRVFGTYDAMGTAGLILASMTFSLTVKNNYSLSAELTVGSYFIAMVLSLFLKDAKPAASEQSNPKPGLRAVASSLFRNKRFILFLIAAALLAESSQTITVFLNQLQYLASGIQPGQMGFIYILVTVSGLLSAYSHKLTKRFGESTAIKLLISSAAVACIIMSVFANAVLSVLGIILLRVAASVFLPIGMSIQNRQVETGLRATTLSFYSVSMNTIGIVTNLVFGKMADAGIKYAMIAGSVFCIASLVLYIMWAKGSMQHRSAA